MLTRALPRLLPLLALLAACLFPAAALAQFGDEPRLAISAAPQRPAVHPGDQFALAVVIQYQPTWHSWPNFKPPLPRDLEDLDIRLTTISVPPASDPASVAGLTIHTAHAQWPAPHEEKVAGSMVLAFSGRIIVFVPVVVAPDAQPGARSIALAVAFQACDASTCEAPDEITVNIPLTILPSGQPLGPSDAATPEAAALFADFQPAVFARILAGEAPASPAAGPATWRFDFFGATFSLRADAYALILLIAFAAGVLMNFTPCVLPVIPLKILSLQAHAKTPGKLVSLGFVYCGGIVTLYLILGLLAFGLITGGRRFDWGQLFSLPWFTLSVAAVVAVLGLAMIGGWALRLPNFVYAFNPTGDTIQGNFLGGLLTGVLATPCTGPLLGASFAWAVTQPPLVGLTAISTLGVGMAAPYALLILFPRLLDKMPRGGPGSELLKQVLGGFMLAVAAYLAGNIFEGTWPWWVVFGVAAAASLWLAIGAWRLLRTTRAKLICTVLGLVGAVACVAMARSLTREGPLDWAVFKDQPDAAITAAITDARSKGRVVVADFTAKWCVNCQVIEKTVLNSDEGVRILTAPDVRLVKVDLTNATPEQSLGWGVVKDIAGGGGIPLIAVFGPALEKPIYFQSFFGISDLEAAVAAARGR